MAFSSRELLLILRARDEASRIVRGFANEFANVDAAAQKSARNMMSAGSALTSVGVGIAGVGAAGLAWMKSSTDMAVEFNKKVAYTATQLDGVAASQKNLADVIKRTGNDIAVPIDQLHAGLYDIFSSMEVNLPQSEMLLRSFAKEAVAGQVELKEASRATIGILNAFHLRVEDVTRVQDVQFQLVRKGVGTYEEFARVMGRATPSAARAGQSVETLSGMLAYLTRNGLSAAMAAASAGRAFDAFAHPKTVDRLEQMGIQVRDSQGNFRDFVDVIRDLQEAFKDMGAPERAAALQELFKGSGGTIQARRFYDAVLKDKESVEQFAGLVGDMHNAQGAFEQAYNTMANTTATKSDLIKNRWELLRVEVGQALIPALEKLMEIISVVLGWWNSLDEGLKKQIITWTAIAAVGAVALGIVVMMAGGFLMLAGAAAMAGIGVGALLGIFVGVVAAIAGLVFAIIWLKDNWTSVIQSLGDAWKWLQSVIQPVIDWFVEHIGGKVVDLWNRVSRDIIAAVKEVARWVIGVWNEILSWARTNWPMIQRVIEPFIDWFVSVWHYVSDALRNVLRFIVDSFDAAWTIIAGIFTGVWYAISYVIEGLISIFKGLIQFVVAVLTLEWGRAWEGIVMVFKGIWLIFVGIFKGAWEIIKSIVVGVLQFLGSLIANGFQFILHTIQVVLDAFGRLWNQFWNWVGSFLTQIFTGIKKGTDSFLSGFANAWDVAVGWVKRNWDKLGSILKVPVNFVIDVIYNKGIRWFINTVAGFIGLGGLPEAKLLADGGYISGPGGPRDDRIPAMLSNGEYVVPAKATSRYYPLLEAMRRGERLPGFAEGGVVGGDGPLAKVLDWIGGAAEDVVQMLSSPFKFVMDKVSEGGKWLGAIATAPVKLVGKAAAWLWKQIELAGPDASFRAGNNIQGLHQWIAKEDIGSKVYEWGAVGPRTYDCSGLVGTLWALTQGKEPFRRYFTTDTMAAGKFNMSQGHVKNGFNVYLGPGHTAANIGGIHVEAYGGNGKRLTVGKVGTALSFYNRFLHVNGMADGGFVDMKNNEVRRLQSFLAVGWPEPAQVFDRGGWMQPGWNYNGTGRPEAVLDPNQSQALLRLADGHGGGGTTVIQHFHITTQEIDPRKHAADLGYEIVERRAI